MVVKDFITIDAQGFKNDNNEFIFKELAITFNNNEYQNFLIEPPFPFERLSRNKQKEAIWLRNNHHHLNWNDGSVSFKSVQNFLKENICITTDIYVKGIEKTEWIKDILGDNWYQVVVNIEDLGCENLKSLQKNKPPIIQCPHHYTTGCCALKTSFLIRSFVNSKKNY